MQSVSYEDISRIFKNDGVVTQQKTRQSERLLETIGNFKCFNEQSKSLKEAVGRINESLSSKSTNYEHNLLLLECILTKDFPKEVFGDNCKLWTAAILKILKSKPCDDVTRLCFRLAQILLELSSDSPELSRDLCSALIPHIIPMLCNSNNKLLEVQASCIMSCLKYYSNACRPFQKSISGFLTGLFECCDTNLTAAQLQSICVVYAYLPVMGNTGHGSANRSLAWNRQATSVIRSLESLMEQLCQLGDISLDDHTSDKADAEGVELILCSTKFSVCSVDNVLELQRRILVLMSILNAMIQIDTSFPVTVPVKETFGIICRFVDINNSSSGGRLTSEAKFIAVVMSELIVGAIALLKALTESCGSLILSYSSTIAKIFAHTFNWTKAEGTVGSTKFSSIRHILFSCLETLLIVNPSAFSIVTNDIIITEILASVQLAQQSDNLRLNLDSCNRMMRNKSYLQKLKRSHGQTSAVSSAASIDRGSVVLSNTEKISLSLSALKVLRRICQTWGPTMVATTYQKIVGTVLDLCLCLPVAPSSESNCRLNFNDNDSWLCELYSLLLSVVLQGYGSVPSVHKVPPPLQTTIALFSRNLNHSSVSVRQVCQDGILLCNKLVDRKMLQLVSSGGSDVFQTFDESCVDNSVSEDVAEQETRMEVDPPIGNTVASPVEAVQVLSPPQKTSTVLSSSVEKSSTTNIPIDDPSDQLVSAATVNDNPVAGTSGYEQKLKPGARKGKKSVRRAAAKVLQEETSQDQENGLVKMSIDDSAAKRLKLNEIVPATCVESLDKHVSDVSNDFALMLESFVDVGPDL